MEIANQQSKVSTPVVEVELVTGTEGQARTHSLQMRGPEFEVFLDNLRKIKEQLGQLVGEG